MPYLHHTFNSQYDTDIFRYTKINYMTENCKHPQHIWAVHIRTADLLSGMPHTWHSYHRKPKSKTCAHTEVGHLCAPVLNSLPGAHLLWKCFISCRIGNKTFPVTTPKPFQVHQFFVLVVLNGISRASATIVFNRPVYANWLIPGLFPVWVKINESQLN